MEVQKQKTKLKLKYPEIAICHKQHFASTINYANPEDLPAEFTIFQPYSLGYQTIHCSIEAEQNIIIIKKSFLLYQFRK